jgi:hypothetical protein
MLNELQSNIFGSYGPYIDSLSRAEKPFKKQLVSKLILKSVFHLQHVSGKPSMAIILTICSASII